MVEKGMERMHYGKGTPAPGACYPPMQNKLGLNPNASTTFNTIQGSQTIPINQIEDLIEPE